MNYMVSRKSYSILDQSFWDTLLQIVYELQGVSESYSIIDQLFRDILFQIVSVYFSFNLVYIGLL